MDVIIVIALIAFVAAMFVSRLRQSRVQDRRFSFVYVNQDGSVREVSPEERGYLSEKFSGGDGGRPYIKPSFESRDGWGSLSGFMARRHVPSGTRILPVHQDYDTRKKQLQFDDLDTHRAAGDIIETQEGGAIACYRNPKISETERFELIRNWHLTQQRKREILAACHSESANKN